MHNDVSRQSHKLLRRDLTIVNEIKATQGTTSSDRSPARQPPYKPLDERQMQVINKVKRQAELLRQTNASQLGTEETLKMMAEAQ